MYLHEKDRTPEHLNFEIPNNLSESTNLASIIGISLTLPTATSPETEIRSCLWTRSSTAKCADGHGTVMPINFRAYEQQRNEFESSNIRKNSEPPGKSSQKFQFAVQVEILPKNNFLT